MHPANLSQPVIASLHSLRFRMLELASVTLRYGDQTVVCNLSVNIPHGARYALLGASGSGKSTILRAIIGAWSGPAGSADRKALKTDGQIAFDCDEKPIIGYDPQEPSLASWLPVQGNILLPLRLKGLAIDEASRAWVNELCRNLHLERYVKQYPAQLSVGTSKRVSLARALVLRPTLLLFDEPFAGFDFDLRRKAINLILRYLDESKATLLMVTHDPYEVAHLTDQALILTGDESSAVRWAERGDVDLQQFRENVLRELEQILAQNNRVKR